MVYSSYTPPQVVLKPVKAKPGERTTMADIDAEYDLKIQQARERVKMEKTEPTPITQESIERYARSLTRYLDVEKPFDREFERLTYLLDMLYFMGASIDSDLYCGPDGFERFKAELASVMSGPHPVGRMYTQDPLMRLGGCDGIQ